MASAARCRAAQRGLALRVPRVSWILLVSWVPLEATSFERELSRSQQFTLASEAGPQVLRVSGHIVNLVVNVPPQVGNELDYVMKAGEMTLILDVRDSETGDPLARVADRRAIQPGSATLGDGFRSGPVASWGAFRDICAGWARVLRDGLDSLRALPAVPVPHASGDAPSG